LLQGWGEIGYVSGGKVLKIRYQGRTNKRIAGRASEIALLADMFEPSK
jgi:hypothetical protein